MYVGFVFQVIWHDYDIINLRISAWNRAFGGAVETYEAIGHLRDAAQQLRGFPKSPTDMREIVFGNFEPKYAGGGVRMRFHCTDGAGHAQVEAKMVAKDQLVGTVQEVVLAMPVEAAAVDAFVQELEQLEAERAGTAHLKGEGIS